MRIEVDAHIEHRLPHAEIFLAERMRATDGADDDVGRPAQLGQILGARMADGDARIAAQEHHRDGLAHHKASTDNHNMLSHQGNLIEVENLHACLRRAGREAVARVGEHGSKRRKRDAVDVLLRRKHVAQRFLVEKARQGAKHETAVHGFVVVDGLQRRLHGGLRSQVVKHVGLGGKPQAGGALLRGALVGQIVGALPHAHESERGLDAARFERLNAIAQVDCHMIDDRFSFEKRCHNPP